VLKGVSVEKNADRETRIIFMPKNNFLAVVAIIGCVIFAAPVRDDATTTKPSALPGAGLSQHDFFYAGEGRTEQMFIVRHGKIDWSYTHNALGEISDAVRLSNGNILFAHQFGVTEITPNRNIVWNFNAPPGTEIHVAKPIGTDHVLMIENGSPAKLIVMNIVSGRTEREFELPVKNPTKVHPQFRDAELTPAGTVMVAHMDLGKVVEYDDMGKNLWEVDVPGVWAVQPLANGNILVSSGKKFVREIDRDKQTVWEWTPADTPEYHMASLQTARRLSNGNTIITNWQSPKGSIEGVDPAKLPLQAIEVTPDKKVVWALREWQPPNNLGPSTRIQVLDDGNAISEKVHFGDIR
jgi:hypothetical protein